MPEEHGVGDRAEERRADDHAGHRERVGVAGRHAGGDQADHADDRRDEVEGRRELGSVDVDGVALAVDAGHGGDARAARLDALALAGHAGRLALDRHEQRDARVASATPALATSRTTTSLAVAPAEEQGAQRHQAVGAAQQPAVAERHLAPTGRDPEERQPADGPLQQHRGSVEADHSRPRLRADPPSHEVAEGRPRRRR